MNVDDGILDSATICWEVDSSCAHGENERAIQRRGAVLPQLMDSVLVEQQMGFSFVLCSRRR